MKILFTRHGESEANIHRVISNRDLPHQLTEVGISQSSALAEELLKWNVRKLITSPIPRGKETANIVAKKLGLQAIISSALREFDCGEMEGRGDKEAWTAYQAVVRAWDEERDYDHRILPDGESFNDLKARFLPFIVSLIEDKEQFLGDVLLVSHGGLLHQMLPLVITNVDRAFTKQHPLGNCELIVTQILNEKLICTEWACTSLV